MDFRRIEVIFIIVFAILNAYLFGSYWQYQLESGSTTSSNTSRNTTILKEMRNDQITYMPLSNKKHTGFYATAKVDTSMKDGLKHLAAQKAKMTDDDRISSTFNTPFAINPNQPQKILDAFIKDRDNVIAGSEYRYNSNLSNSTRVVYTQLMDDHPIYSQAGEIIFNIDANNKITGYTQGHLTGKAQLRERSDLITQTKAVTWLYQYNEIQNNSKIEWADLSYTNLLNTENGVVYVPTWVIGIKDKSSAEIEVKRINAFSGVLIKKDSGVTKATKPADQSSAKSSTKKAASDSKKAASSSK